MTMQKILNSLPIIQKVLELKLPFKKAYEVYSLAKQINDKRDFFINEEKKLIAHFHVVVSDEGRVVFSNAEDQQGFQKEYNEILNCELEGLSAIELKIDDLEEARFSSIEIAALEGVINFIN